MKKILKKVFLVFMILIILLTGVGFFYVNDYYKASENALEELDSVANDYVTKVNDDNTQITLIPDEIKAGLIFYPGGKVQYESYVPLLSKLAENGVLCVLVHMPGNLAVLDMDAADGIKEEFPEVKEWYLAGHSLGGAMAASYMGDHASEYAGLILLASYSTADLSDTDLKVLSIYGTEDMVLGMEKYEENRANLPSDYEEVIIEGGCHAYYGDYGEQKGDGTAKVSREEQQRQVVEAILCLF